MYHMNICMYIFIYTYDFQILHTFTQAAEIEALVGKELADRIVALVKKAVEEKKSDAKDEDSKDWEVEDFLL
jgi:hypothetical protein